MPKAAFDLLIALDTEYVEMRRTPGGERLPGNNVLSYQAAIVNLATGLKVSGVFYPHHFKHTRHRIMFRSFLSRALNSAHDWGLFTPEIHERIQRRDPVRIALAAHYSRADLPAFRDFDRLKSKVDAVRGTYASILQPVSGDATIAGYGHTPLTITLIDTRLLAPAGYGSLDRLGELLGHPKGTIPEVIDERGRTVDGKSRMDLVRDHHPKIFDAYAKRDTEITADWVTTVFDLAERWGVSDPPATIAQLAVAKFRQIAAESVNILRFTGRMRDGRHIVPIPAVADVTTLAADCFHGGYNQAFAHGLYDGGFTDIDLKGAYTTALAVFRQPAWEHRRFTTNIDEIAALDAITFARVRFKFPGHVRSTPRPDDTIRKLTTDPRNYVTRGSSYENPQNPESVVSALKEHYGGTRLGAQEIEGRILSDVEGSLFPPAVIRYADSIPPLHRTIVAIDPAGGTRDEAGIVVAGVLNPDTPEARYYILADLSERSSPANWGAKAVQALDRYKAQSIVIESNSGGAAIEAVIRNIGGDVPIKLIAATAAKAARAEPISTLYERRKVWHAEPMPELERQLSLFTPNGWGGPKSKSPDRADSAVLALQVLSGRTRKPPPTVAAISMPKDEYSPFT